MKHDEIYKIISKYKANIFNGNNSYISLHDRLLKYDIIIPKYITNKKELHDYLNPDIDKKCQGEGCNNERKFNSVSCNRYPDGYKKFCSKECLHKWRSLNQTGDNNTCHKMTTESFNSMREKLSIIMIEKIKNKTFIPNITNSWCRSKIGVIIDGNTVYTRSSWEAFFHIMYPHYMYEKLIIQYIYENKERNYIVDFIDEISKTVFEIKPFELIDNGKNKTKTKYCIEWCNNNNYSYKTISQDWFIQNFEKNIHILDNQPNKEKILKNINNMIRHENKKNIKN